MLPGDQGVLAVELHRRRYLTTPPQVRRAALKPQDLVVVDAEGTGLDSDRNMPPAVWGYHQAAFGVTRDLGHVGCSILALTVSVMALSDGEPDDHLDLPGFKGLPILRKAKAADNQLTDTLKRSRCVALRGVGLLATGENLSDTLCEVERIEHAAKLAMLTL